MDKKKYRESNDLRGTGQNQLQAIVYGLIIGIAIGAGILSQIQHLPFWLLLILAPLLVLAFPFLGAAAAVYIVHLGSKDDSKTQSGKDT